MAAAPGAGATQIDLSYVLTALSLIASLCLCIGAVVNMIGTSFQGDEFPLKPKVLPFLVMVVNIYVFLIALALLIMDISTPPFCAQYFAFLSLYLGRGVVLFLLACLVYYRFGFPAFAGGYGMAIGALFLILGLVELLMPKSTPNRGYIRTLLKDNSFFGGRVRSASTTASGRQAPPPPPGKLAPGRIRAVSSPTSAEKTTSGGAATTPTSGGRKSRQFSMKSSPPCEFCGKPVYKTEEVTNGKGAIFHDDCLKCSSCKVSLSGLEPVTKEERTGPLRTGQYLVDEESNLLLCEKHAGLKTRTLSIKGASKDVKARDDAELAEVERTTKEQNLQSRENLQSVAGNIAPVCSRCGNALEKNQEIMVSGMERYHLTCPTAEETATMIRSVRHFAQKVPERIAITFTCDRVAKLPLTFLFVVEKSTAEAMMKLKKYDSGEVLYKPEVRARASFVKKFQAPAEENREFDMTIRDMPGFSFENPQGVPAKPQWDRKSMTLVVKKFKLANGVLQTLTLSLAYDEEKQICESDKVTIAFEMWPPFSEDQKKVLDPLAKLRGQLRDTRSESASSDEEGDASSVRSVDGGGKSGSPKPSAISPTGKSGVYSKPASGSFSSSPRPAATSNVSITSRAGRDSPTPRPLSEEVGSAPPKEARKSNLATWPPPKSPGKQSSD